MSRTSSAMSEALVSRIASDAIADAFRRLPYDAQDPQDTDLSEHYLLASFDAAIASRLRKVEENLKKEIKAGRASGELLSKNYKRTVEYGTPRRSFDKDAFIEQVSEKLKIPKHKLIEIAAQESCQKMSATPISLTVDYVGDIPRETK